MAGGFGYPTILLVQKDRQFSDVLWLLQKKGYLILEAQDEVQALGIVVLHSRRIHLLLTDDTDDSRVMAATLKPYRPDMHVIHISSSPELSSVLTEVSKAMEASQVVDSPARGFEDQEPPQGNKLTALTAEVDAARRRYLALSRDFLGLTKEAPLGVPHPDGIIGLEPPVYERRRAFDAYIKARQNLENHIAAANTRIRPQQEKKQGK